MARLLECRRDIRRTHGTTAEITVLSVDAREPTGSWITINWDRFGHVQTAWLEALQEPIWTGSVLLIARYYLRASHCLAWAPRLEPLAPRTPHLSASR